MKIAIAGIGTIGRKVVSSFVEGHLKDFELVAVSSGQKEKAQEFLLKHGLDVPCVDNNQIADHADVVVDCAPTAAFPSIAIPTLENGKKLVTVSGAGILAHPEIVAMAHELAGQIILATGALLGFDAVRAAAEGKIYEVTMITRKPPMSLRKAPYLREIGIDVDMLVEATCVFKGTAREGAAAFPANVNVAAALGLAGIGPDLTKLEIWADPALTRNTHHIVVDSNSAKLQMSIENIPTEENPGTGKITSLSLIACLRGLTNPLRVGS